MEKIQPSMTLEQHAILFAALAQQGIQRFGEEGLKAVFSGIRRYGEGRGQRMALYACMENQTPDLTGYLVFGEIDTSENSLRIVKKDPYLEIHALSCAWYTAWEKAGLMEFGRLYCQEIDCAVLRGFDPGFEFSVDGTLSNGANQCRFLYKGWKMDLPAQIKLFWLKKFYKQKYIRPYSFHIQDLYSSMLVTFIEYFGKEGKEAADSALDVIYGI